MNALQIQPGPSRNVINSDRAVMAEEILHETEAAGEPDGRLWWYADGRPTTDLATFVIG